MATPINAPMAGEIWHLSIEDLFQPVQQAPRLGGDGPFVINLSVSTAPISVPTKALTGSRLDAHIYQIQVSEDGRTRFRLRLGPFTSEDEADAILAEVRDTYPGAFTATVGAADLRAIGSIQAKAEQRQSAQKPAPVVAKTEPCEISIDISWPTPAPAAPVLNEPVAPVLTEVVAPARSPARKIASPLPAVIAVPLPTQAAPKHTAPAVPPQPAIIPPQRPAVPKSAAPIEPAKPVAAKSAAPIEPVKPPAAQSAAPIEPAKPEPVVTQSLSAARKFASPKFAALAGKTSKLTSLQHVVATAPASAPREVKELDQPLESLESTQTMRALTPRELEDGEASRWFVIQLALADHAFDPDAVPNLDIFSEYRLYSVAGLDEGRVVHALRLGFFREEMGAVAVASYLAAYWDKPAIKRVSVAERERFADQRVEARKDVGAVGKHAVIEITDELVARRRRSSKTSAAWKPSNRPS
jgi:hypothetical protein